MVTWNRCGNLRGDPPAKKERTSWNFWGKINLRLIYLSRIICKIHSCLIADIRSRRAFVMNVKREFAISSLLNPSAIPSHHRDIQYHRRYSFKITVPDISIEIYLLIIIFFDETNLREHGVTFSRDLLENWNARVELHEFECGPSRSRKRKLRPSR